MTATASGCFLRASARTLEAVYARHLEVDEEDRPALIADPFDGGGPVRRRGDGVAVLLEPCRQRLTNNRLVVNDENARAFLDHDSSCPRRWLSSLAGAAIRAEHVVFGIDLHEADGTGHDAARQRTMEQAERMPNS